MILEKLRLKAYNMGVQDGLRWKFQRTWSNALFKDYYRPPLFFRKLYDIGFDKGAELEANRPV